MVWLPKRELFNCYTLIVAVLVFSTYICAHINVIISKLRAFLLH